MFSSANVLAQSEIHTVCSIVCYSLGWGMAYMWHP